MPYLAPENINEALDFLRATNSKIVAGGTDFFPSLMQGEMHSDILDVTKVNGLRGIKTTESGWNIGAATTWTDVMESDLPRAFDGLKLAAREVGSIQIQNRGTVAGNICNASPAADGVPPLLTLNAVVELASSSGRRSVPLENFITGVRQTEMSPDEFAVSVSIPAVSHTARSHFQKLGSRKYLVISIAMVAVLIDTYDEEITDARIAVGSCSPVARRLTKLEEDLKGMHVSEIESFQIDSQSHLSPLNPITDVRGTSDYRLDTIGEICRRSIMKAAVEG